MKLVRVWQKVSQSESLAVAEAEAEELVAVEAAVPVWKAWVVALLDAAGMLPEAAGTLLEVVRDSAPRVVVRRPEEAPVG